MTTLTVKAGDSVTVRVTIPRDLSIVSEITAHLERNGVVETATPTVQTTGSEESEVDLDLGAVDLAAGYWDLEFELEYEDGTVETLPAAGYDTVRVVADLA